MPNGDEIAFNCSVRCLSTFARDCFADGHLDAEKLKKSLEKDFYNGNIAARAYRNYVVEKTMRLILYMNEFRRYTDAGQIIQDFQQATGGVNHCGPQKLPYFFDFGFYPSYFFRHYVREFWQEFAPNGALDNRLFYDFMIGRHSRGIEKYGLEAVIRRNYKKDSPCHPEVLFPYRGGAGPVYVERDNNTGASEAKHHRRFIKSCGEGKGPNAIADHFEFHLVKGLIESDPKYTVVKGFGERTLLVPKEDTTLPVYDCYRGKIAFDSPEIQEATIKGIWESNR